MRNQRVWVIPSLDMVIVRMGEPGELDPDTRNSVWQSQPGMIDYEIPRLVVQAVTDVRFPDPAPYEMGAPDRAAAGRRSGRRRASNRRRACGGWGSRLRAGRLHARGLPLGSNRDRCVFDAEF